MKEEYDFDQMTGRKNPYASKLKQQITIQEPVGCAELAKRIKNDDAARRVMRFVPQRILRGLVYTRLVHSP